MQPKLLLQPASPCKTRQQDSGRDGDAIPLSTLLEHCPASPPAQAPGSLFDLEEPSGLGLMATPKRKWPGTWSAAAVSVLPEPPSDLRAAKRREGKKKSEPSDNMDSGKSRGGKSQTGEEKKREKIREERRCRRAKRQESRDSPRFSNDVGFLRVERKKGR